MTLATHELIRRFVMHGASQRAAPHTALRLFANGNQAANLARMRELLGVANPEPEPPDARIGHA